MIKDGNVEAIGKQRKISDGIIIRILNVTTIINEDGTQKFSIPEIHFLQIMDWNNSKEIFCPTCDVDSPLGKELLNMKVGSLYEAHSKNPFSGRQQINFKIIEKIWTAEEYKELLSKEDPFKKNKAYCKGDILVYRFTQSNEDPAQCYHMTKIYGVWDIIQNSIGLITVQVEDKYNRILRLKVGDVFDDNYKEKEVFGILTPQTFINRFLERPYNPNFDRDNVQKIIARGNGKEKGYHYENGMIEWVDDFSEALTTGYQYKKTK